MFYGIILRYCVYNMNAEKLRNELAAEGTASSAIKPAVKEQYPFELVAIRAVRGTDGNYGFCILCHIICDMF